jgi:hypothetical protein
MNEGNSGIDRLQSTQRASFPSMPAMPALLALLLLAAIGHAQVPAPIPSPYGDTSFVGKVRVTFDDGFLQGRIYYTLDGSTPNAWSTVYSGAFTIDTTTVLKAIRIRGVNPSPVTEVAFIQRKLPKPRIVFDGKPEFTGNKKVTLALDADIPDNAPNANTAPRIHYTTDGGAPDSIYSGMALTLVRSGQLIAVARHPDFEPSDPASQQFTLLVPVAAPKVAPPGQTFTEKSLKVTFSTTTPTAYFQYSLDPDGNPATAGMVSTDGTATLVGENPGDTLVLRVVAMKAGMANSPVVEERYVYQPPAAKPVADPPPTFFHDTLTVSLSSATPDAAIHYTLNGNLPTANTLLYEGPFLIDSTVSLRAIAFRAGGGHPSEVFSGTYSLRLSPPVADPPGREYTDILQVRLKAVSPGARTLYTLDGSLPTRSSAALAPGDVITLSKEGVTELKAICVKGDVESPIASYAYAKRQDVTTTPEPSILPSGRDFLDSLTVEIRVQEPNATIRYTLDGTEPMEGSPLYLGPLRLRASATLKAYAQVTGLLPSAVRSETYVMVPSPPVADPPAALPIPNRGEVKLSARTAGATIYYFLDDQPFTWEAIDAGIAREYRNPIIFVTDTRIRAVAVSGSGDTRRMSQVMDQSYKVYSGLPNDTLAAGQARSFSEGFSLANKGPAPAKVRLAGFNDLGLDGFLSPTLSVTLAAAAGQAFPSLEFKRPDGSGHAVYRMGISGRPEFVGAAAAVAINKPGTYFAAVDTQIPAISLLPVQPREGGPVTVQLFIEDNVDGLVCDVTGSGIAAAGMAVKAGPDGLHTFTLAASGQDLRSLWFRARVGDGRNETRFPADPSGRYVVPQVWSKLRTPSSWTLGKPDQPYDLAGFPVRGNGTVLTWGQVKRDNPDPALVAWIWRDGGYFPLTDADALTPGTGLWLGSSEARSSLMLSKFHSSESGPDGLYRVLLKPGWNLIANPALERMYWPAARTSPARYAQSRVFGLWRYEEAIDDYQESDSLEAWKGYWVWNDLARDTSVAISPVPPPPAKVAAPADMGSAAPAEVELLLDYGRSLPLRLGARAYGRDEVGLEDEPQLPPWRGRREAWSARNRSRLMTDVLRFEPGGVLHWKLVLQGAPAPGKDSLIKVIGSRLPPSFEAWAWLPARNLKVNLEQRAGLSIPGNGPDTVHVFAGPAAKLASLPELSRAVEGVAAFSASLRLARRGTELRLALPTDASVTADLWSPAGRRLARVFSGRLGSGIHVLPIGTDKAAGVAFLRIRASGRGLDEAKVLKFAR